MITEGLIVEVARHEHWTRIWYMEDPHLFDSIGPALMKMAYARVHARFMPAEACVFAPAAPKTMSFGDRIVVKGPALAIWYPHPSRPLTHHGVPFALRELAIELLPNRPPIDPRGRQLLKVV